MLYAMHRNVVVLVVVGFSLFPLSFFFFFFFFFDGDLFQLRAMYRFAAKSREN